MSFELNEMTQECIERLSRLMQMLEEDIDTVKHILDGELQTEYINNISVVMRVINETKAQLIKLQQKMQLGM